MPRTSIFYYFYPADQSRGHLSRAKSRRDAMDRTQQEKRSHDAIWSTYIITSYVHLLYNAIVIRLGGLYIVLCFCHLSRERDNFVERRPPYYKCAVITFAVSYVMSLADTGPKERRETRTTTVSYDSIVIFGGGYISTEPRSLLSIMFIILYKSLKYIIQRFSDLSIAL